MSTIDLKREVERAVAAEWPVFAADHPHLAAVLDQPMVAETAHAQLLNDPEFREAYFRALAAGTVLEIAATAVQQFVKPWLRRLAGG